MKLLGNYFRKAKSETLQVTVIERIWQIITEIVTQIAAILEIDSEMLMEKLIAYNEDITKILNLKPLLQAG